MVGRRRVLPIAVTPLTLLPLVGSAAMGRTRGGQPRSAVSIVQDGKTHGVQFHPEKSSYTGLRLLRKFVDICRAD